MATRKIVKIGDETLRKVCRKQEKFDLRLAVLLKDMADTMYKADGVGLAAPQVGILRRIAVVDVTADHSGRNHRAERKPDRTGGMPVRAGAPGRRDQADEDPGPVSGPEGKLRGNGSGRPGGPGDLP